MHIRLKLLLSFLFLTLLILSQYILSQYYNSQQARLVQRMIQEHDISRQLGGLAQAAQSIRRYEKEYFIYIHDADRRENYYEEFNRARVRIENYLSHLLTAYAVMGDQLQTEQISVWQEATKIYTEGFETINRQVISGEIDSTFAANDAVRDFKNKFRVLLDGVGQAIERQLVIAESEAAEIYRGQQESGLIFSLFTICSVLLGLYISFKVPLSITRPITELTRIADGISRGKIREKVDAVGSPEIRELGHSIERLRVATQGLLKRLQVLRSAESG